MGWEKYVYCIVVVSQKLNKSLVVFMNKNKILKNLHYYVVRNLQCRLGVKKNMCWCGYVHKCCLVFIIDQIMYVDFFFHARYIHVYFNCTFFLFIYFCNNWLLIWINCVVYLFFLQNLYFFALYSVHNASGAIYTTA